MHAHVLSFKWTAMRSDPSLGVKQQAAVNYEHFDTINKFERTVFSVSVASKSSTVCALGMSPYLNKLKFKKVFAA